MLAFLCVDFCGAQNDIMAQKLHQKLENFRNETRPSLELLDDIAMLTRRDNLKNLFDKQNSNDHSQCYQDWKDIFSHKFSDVAKFWDSFAVPGTGVLEGHTTYLGQSEECVNAKTGFAGIKVRPFPDTEMFLVGFTLIQNPSFIRFKFAICAPVSCSAKQMERAINKLPSYLPPFNVKVQKRDAFKLDSPFIASLIVFGALALLTVSATFYGFLERLRGKFISS